MPRTVSNIASQWWTQSRMFRKLACVSSQALLLYKSQKYMVTWRPLLKAAHRTGRFYTVVGISPPPLHTTAHIYAACLQILQ